MQDVIFDWMWSQIEDAINHRKRPVYRAILTGSWEGATYVEIAEKTKYTEVYLRQTLGPEIWKFLSKHFDVHISKKTLVSQITAIWDRNRLQQNKVDIYSKDSYISTRSPFGDMGCITNDALFFDRTEVINEILDYLHNSWNISIVGERQIGKSSLLRKVCRCAPEVLGLSPYQFIYIDMELIHTEETFFQKLCKEIGVDYYRGYDLLEAVQEKKFILCLDEIEKMRNPSKFSGDEREELRALSDGSHMPFTLIAASRTPLHELFPDDQYSTSPFFNIFQEISLKEFTQEITTQFIKKRLEGNSIQFSNTQIQNLIDKSNGHPGKLQQAARKLYAKLIKEQTSR